MMFAHKTYCNKNSIQFSGRLYIMIKLLKCTLALRMNISVTARLMSGHASYGFVDNNDDGDDELVRITSPHRMANRVREKVVNRQLLEAEFERRRRLGNPVIACHRQAYNLYKGRLTGSKNTPLTALASHGWKHSRSKKDQFSINAFAKRNYFGNESVKSFLGLGLEEGVCRELHQNFGVSNPTLLQKATIPLIMAGENVQIVGENGCGKTLSFIAPLVDMCNGQKWPINCVSSLILTPSRELVMQLYETTSQLKSPYFQPFMLQGQISTESPGNICIATPSSFLKHFSGFANDIKYVVIDEADTMLDDSFIDMVRQVFGSFHPENAQIIFSSATIPNAFQPFLREVGKLRPFQKYISDKIHRLPAHISHKFIRCGPADKSGRTFAEKKIAIILILFIFYFEIQNC